METKELEIRELEILKIQCISMKLKIENPFYFHSYTIFISTRNRYAYIGNIKT